MFTIEDTLHWEGYSKPYATFDEAMAELKRRAEIPWDQEPNRAPCYDWRVCGRIYEIIEIDGDEEVQSREVVHIFSSGVTWTHPLDK